MPSWNSSQTSASSNSERLDHSSRLENEIEAMPVLERKRERKRAEQKLTSYDDKCADDEDALPKIFGTMCQILSNESKETLSTGENYNAIMEGRGDPNALRELIISTHTAPRVGSALMARMAVQERLRTIKQAKDETLVDYRNRVTNAVESFTVHGLDEPDEAEVAVLYLRGLKTSFKLYVSRRMQMANDGAAAIPANLADAHSQVLLYQSSAQFSIDQTQLKSITRSGEKSKPQGRAAYAVTAEGVVEQPQKGAVKGNCNICGDSGHHGANYHHAAAFRQFMKMKESQDEYVVMNSRRKRLIQNASHPHMRHCLEEEAAEEEDADLAEDPCPTVVEDSCSSIRR